MNNEWTMLCLAGLLPVVVSAAMYLLNKWKSFGALDDKYKQIVYGVVFGLLAIFATEKGIPYNGSMVNCRDASVMAAGLLFGAPAGIIAGVIGGVERWIAVAWGVGSFTRLACSISTVLAGIYSAVLRRYMFENKKPGWMLSLVTGIVMEIFHLTMIFLTNLNSPDEAMQVVKTLTAPMVIANGASLMLATMVLQILSKEGIKFKRDQVRISQTIQKWLLVTVLLAFAATSYFVFGLQNGMAESQTDSLLGLALEDISADIEDTSDQHLLKLAHELVDEITPEDDVARFAKAYNVAEINIVDNNGIIVRSNVPELVGFDMASGEQSGEFMCLLGYTHEFVQDYGPITYDSSMYRKYAGVKTDHGFIQVGYDAEQFQKDIDEQIVSVARNRHVGKTGYILILDKQLNIISLPTSVSHIGLLDDFDSTEIPGENITFPAELGVDKCYCRYVTAEGYYIVSVLPEAEALQSRNIALYVNTFMEILVFAVLFGLIYLLIKRVVVNQIKHINNSLAKITGGDLNEIVDVRSNAEFASLSDDINSTVATLKRYIADASARIDKELEFAKNIQSSALPNVFPAFPKRSDFDIYASMDPAKEVGGDFYDFYMTGSDRLNFLVADVSGKGIPAAMFMMRAKTELKSLTEAELPLDTVFTQGNAALCEGNDAGMFVTAWQGGIDLTTGEVSFANAGHNPPLVRHGDGSFEYLKTRAGFVLAGMEGVKYKTQQLRLEPGDIIYLYTDGVTEATDANNELYGEERLLKAVNEAAAENMKELCGYIKEDVARFVGDAPQFDDMTMVAFKYIGTPPAPSIHFDEAKIEDFEQVKDFVEGELTRLECPKKTIFQTSVSLDEIFTNIVSYAYPDGAGPVTVEVIEHAEPHTVSLRFTDEGIPYNPLKKEDPDVTLSAEERNIGGLGIFMVKKLMDDIKYEYIDEKNILTLTKNL